jgi:MFS family permease
MDVAAQTSKRVQWTYYTLMLGNTLAASFIWGVNTLFLLDAGLSNYEAFAANAFFTLGMVVFEVPTGVVADTWGRRTSYLLGTATLAVTTAMYYALWVTEGAFWLWAVVSVLLGLGFTFFSGAVEAWLVDALEATSFDGKLEQVLGRGQMMSGIAMLGGSLLGGVVAQAVNLGAPFVLRVIVLVIMFAVAAAVMRDLGFTPERGAHPIAATRKVLSESIDNGLRVDSVRWIMLSAPFTMGSMFYAFYALQPFLLDLYGDPDAYSIAGLAAAIIAGSQIAGGILGPKLGAKFATRTAPIMLGIGIGGLSLLALGWIDHFAVALVFVIVWGMAITAVFPLRGAYLNGMIPSKQRATVLSFDSLMGNAGGVVSQPPLGRIADASGYGASLAVTGAIQMAAVPCIYLSRRTRHTADRTAGNEAAAASD